MTATLAPEVFADFSHYQTVDLGAYWRAGFRRIVVKATEGTDYTDPTFAVRWRQAGQLGFARVAYHFGRSGNGAAEWAHFIAVVRAAGGLGPRDWVCLDSEDSAHVGAAEANARQFVAAAAADGVRRGLLYTGKWFADPARLTPDDVPGWLLWLSDYTQGQADTAIELPNGWTYDLVAARQYTSRASLPGITGSTDADRILHDWLLAGPAPSEDFMANIPDGEWEEVLRAARQINSATAPGQRDFQGTIEATLGTVQGLVNLLNNKAGALGNQLTSVQTAVAAVAAAANTAHLSDQDKADLAKDIVAVAATALPHALSDQDRDTFVQAVLEGLHARLAA